MRSSTRPLEVEELTHTEHYAKYRFVVQDDGIGMSEAYQKTLFDPFTREERSGTNRVQGTGLGMAITKNIVDLMGGSISVESATGKGTRFEVVLEFPIDAEADAVPKAQALPEEPEDVSPLCGMNFLCAEDNAINAEILELLLESKGAHCKIYPNGQELVDAFARVKPGEYDMILMDVQMPVMDGLEPGHPHPRHDGQRLFGRYAEEQGSRDGRASVQARGHRRAGTDRQALPRYPPPENK